jgi:hypothetical protein
MGDLRPDARRARPAGRAVGRAFFAFRGWTLAITAKKPFSPLRCESQPKARAHPEAESGWIEGVARPRRADISYLRRLETGRLARRDEASKLGPLALWVRMRRFLGLGGRSSLEPPATGRSVWWWRESTEKSHPDPRCRNTAIGSREVSQILVRLALKRSRVQAVRLYLAGQAGRLPRLSKAGAPFSAPSPSGAGDTIRMVY